MPDWTERAASREWPTPDDFFPTSTGPSTAIKRLCAGCGVKDECLGWAILHERYGVWGGVGEETREAMRRRKKIAIEPVGEWTPPKQHTVPPECGTVAAAEWHRAKGEPMDEQCDRALRYAERKRLKAIADKQNREQAS